MSALKSPTEAEILEGMVRPDDADMSPEAARALLQLKFDVKAKRAIDKLLRADAAGTISAADRLLLDRYLRVGELIDLIQAKARLSIRWLNRKCELMAKSQCAIVRARAGDRYEYCRIPQAATSLPHTIDHIRARKHRGADNVVNLCWSCAPCNAAKGSNVAGHDPATDALVPLFNPRSDIWDDHFAWRGARLTGQTPVGRATIDVLRVNDANRVSLRRMLMRVGVF